MTEEEYRQIDSYKEKERKKATNNLCYITRCNSKQTNIYNKQSQTKKDKKILG
jgi:hypothetical protein